MPLFVVETVSVVRYKYVIEAEELTHAYDSVTCNEAKEFSQLFLDEQILSGKEISKKEFQKMIKSLQDPEDGPGPFPETGSYWMGENLIHTVDYEKVE